MAYQPFPTPIGGAVFEQTTGTDPVSLAVAGTEYVVIALKFSDAAQQPDFSPYVILVENISVMSLDMRELEWRLLANPTITGDPLVYSSLGPGSVMVGAFGNGTQIATNGFPAAVGRFVPGDDERLVAGFTGPSVQFPPIVPKSLVGVLVARSFGNNGSVAVRQSVREIEVDESGNPV